MRVVIADDHRLVLDGIKRALESDGGFEIVGETQTGTQVLPLVAKTSPDLVLLDVRMPHMDGLACLDEIKPPPRREGRDAVGVHEPGARRVGAPTGASAYVMKTVNPDDLPATLRQAVEGNVYSAVGGHQGERASAKAPGLTEREIAILGALARGLSNERSPRSSGSPGGREVPPDEHLSEARRQEPHGSDGTRTSGSGREPDLRRRSSP